MPGFSLDTNFNKKDEKLIFETSELSQASIKILEKKIEVLAKDMAELADVDFSLQRTRENQLLNSYTHHG